MANRIVKIEDICHVVKGETGIMKAIPGEFPMVVLSEERKTHNEYQFDCKAVIIPLVSSTGHGHASMKRIHYQEGKFALGSILCALIPKNEGEYDPEYLYHILDMGKERIFVPLMKGMANVSLPMNRIKSVEINLPPYDEQVRLSKIYSEVTANLDLLKNQTDKQQKYLKQLRQSILQLAVQGKLTAKWRDENPNVETASVLLEKIKADKEKQIREGKIKREKPLPKITENEKPFEIPESWAWCRLSDIAEIIMGQSPESHTYNKIGQGLPFYQGKKDFGSVYPAGVSVWCTEPTRIANENDILISVRAPVGDVNISKETCAIGRGLSIIRLYEINSLFFVFSFLDYFKRIWTTKGSFFDSINKEHVYNLVLPQPPLEEQKEIVNKVNKLMSLCDELEKKIEKRDSYQERIMQAVVKQAFTTKLETVETE